MERAFPDIFACIRCMTYNQSAYIADALNGFCMQQTSFPFLAIVMDDASTDGEQAVIEDYIKGNFLLSDISCQKWETEEARWLFAQHRENSKCYFLVIFLKRNMYKQKQAKLELIKEWEDGCKYLALCEGDDYWTDPLKLQKQVDYLEEHYDCIMSVHAANWEEGVKMAIKGACYENECDLTIEEIICNGGLYLANASTLYRRDAVPTGSDRPLWWRMSDVGDYPLHIYAALNGMVHFFPEPMCVYRFQHPGSWTYNQSVTKDIRHAKCEIDWLTVLDRETEYNYSKAIYKHLYNYYYLLYTEKEMSAVPYYSAIQYYRAVCNTGMISRNKYIKQVFKRVYIMCCRIRYRNTDA